jgi:tRNA nucleotidyltransferase/poly(A) polymerase/8-oxo-dGTP pyrophosphatase MutT (NUDIX family)
MVHGNVGQSDLTREDMIRYEWGRTDSGIYHSSVYDNGELVGTIGLKSFDREELNSQCYDDFEWVLRELEWKSNRSIQDWHISKWVVFDVWLDEAYRNKGIGYKMYENIFKIKNNNPHTIIVGYKCEPGGTTSYDAKSVYERLQRNYIGKGLVVSSIQKDGFAAERIYFDDEYGGFIKGNPRANELPGEVLFPGEDERLAKIMTPEEFAELEQEVNLILSKNLPYNVESLSEDELIALHEDIILKIINHEYIHQSIDEEVLDWARENNKTKGDYYAGHEIMAYVDMALRESLGMRGFKLHLASLVSQHPILTDNPELGERVMDALTRTRKGQRFQVPAEIETLMQAFQSEDYEILVVGGAVRDMLMGLKPKDYDLATNATPEQVEDVVSPLVGYRVIITPEAQMARGVLTTLVLPPSGEVVEVTTFRAELGYEDGTRRPVAVAADTFYEDSLRRDFTMNALGWRLNGTILDYHEGVDDIEFGQLVAVGDASERLEEDPLRILRAVRFASRYGLEIDDELGGAIETNLPQLLTLSPERIRRELDSILKLEEGVYDLVNIGIIETIIPQYQGGYWGDRGYGGGDPKFSFIADIQSYSMVDQSYPSQFNYTPRPWQPSIAYALLFKNVVTKEEFNEQYRRGPISFSKAEADMIAELIELYSVALESEEPRDIVTIVTSPYYDELMLMLEYTNRLDLVDYFTPYRQRYKGKPPKGYAMTVADEYGIQPGPALGERLSEITDAIILGDIEDWDEGLNYYAAEDIIDYSKRGICDIVALAETKKLLSQGIDDFLVVEGYVWTKDAEAYEWDYPDAHTWIKLKDGTIIDPSEKQYEDEGGIVERYDTFAYDQLNDFYKEAKWYTPNEYLSLWGELIQTAEEVGTRERIAYAGVILDEETSEQLLARFESEIPESWTRYAHHMTVSLGKSIPNQADLGKEIALTVTAIGKSDDAIAVAVSGYPSRNAIPHITLAIPPGGKPFNSNKITDWHSVEPFEIQGQLQDVKTYVAEEIETFESESSRDWSRQYTWQPVPIEDFMDFRRNRYSITNLAWSWDDILNLKTLYRGTRKPSSIRDGLFDLFGRGEINEFEQIPETVYFYTWERPYPTEQWGRHNADWECACDECDKYAFSHSFANYKESGLIHSNQFKPEWEEIPEGSEVVRVLFVPHISREIGVGPFHSYRSHVTRNNLNLDQYGFEPVIWSTRNSKNSNGEFYSSPYNTNLRALEQRLGRNVGRTLNYPNFSSETVTKYAESFWGDAGSGVLVVARDTQRILLGLRSEDVNEPNTWGNFGGAIGISDSGELEEALPPEDNALKEMAEEIGYTGAIEMMPSFTYRSPEFTYYNFIGVVDQESDVPLNQFNWEVSRLQWFTLAEIMALPNLHFGVSALMSQEEMSTFNAPGIADEEYRKVLKKDFEITMRPQFVLFEELPQITQDDIVYMASHPTWGNSELSKEYGHIHPNYLKRDFIGLEFPVFYMPLSEIDFPPNHRRRHMPTVIKYSKQQNSTEAPPILVSGDNFIDGGHRFLAYELAGRRTIPVVDIGNLLTVTGLLDWIESSAMIEDPISWDVGEDSLLDFTFNAEEMIDLGIPTLYYNMTNPPLQSVKYDDFGNPFVTFYHATTMDNYESIEAFGLRMGEPGYYEKGDFETYDNVAGVYFTSDLEKAKVWIGWKYRESICYQMESLEEDGYEVSLIPNEIAGVIYAVDFPLELLYDDLIEYKWSVQNLKLDPEVVGAWYSTNSIPRSEMSIVGFYSLPICLGQGWNDGGEGVQPIAKSMAKQIHERGFYVDAIPNPDYDEFRQDISTDSAMIAKHGYYQTPFTDATRRGRRYLPLHHILSPRDPIFSGFRGTFMSESIPKEEYL